MKVRLDGIDGAPEGIEQLTLEDKGEGAQGSEDDAEGGGVSKGEGVAKAIELD